MAWHNPTVVLITIGYGGWCLYFAPEGDSTSQRTGYGDDWRRFLDGSDPEVVIPPNTPVVDCTVEGVDLHRHAVGGPMFHARMAPNEVSEFLGKTVQWDGSRASGMASVGRDVYVAHAFVAGCRITDAQTGEAWPTPPVLPTGKAPAKGDAVALGVAIDPQETLLAVVHSELTADPKEN